MALNFVKHLWKTNHAVLVIWSSLTWPRATTMHGIDSTFYDKGLVLPGQTRQKLHMYAPPQCELRFAWFELHIFWHVKK